MSTRPHYFYCPSPDFTNYIVSQLVTNNRCAPSCGWHKRKVRGHIKKFSAGASRRHSTPTWKLLPTPLLSASGCLLAVCFWSVIDSHNCRLVRRRSSSRTATWRRIVGNVKLIFRWSQIFLTTAAVLFCKRCIQ